MGSVVLIVVWRDAVEGGIQNVSKVVVEDKGD